MLLATSRSRRLHARARIPGTDRETGMALWYAGDTRLSFKLSDAPTHKFRRGMKPSSALCPRCGKLFSLVTRGHQAIYCSIRCRNYINNRQYRISHKEQLRIKAREYTRRYRLKKRPCHTWTRRVCLSLTIRRGKCLRTTRKTN